MEERHSREKLLVLRRLTRAISDLLRGQLKDYLSTLAPSLRPRSVLADYLQGSTKETLVGSDKAFQDLQSIYEAVAGAKPFNLPKELKPPLEIVSSTLEMTPMEYTHVAKTERESKSVVITSPLKWVLTYSGFGPGRLKELLAGRSPAADDLDQFVLHYSVMHIVLSKQAGVSQILDGLRFPLSSGRVPEFGELPIIYISSPASTVRPPDEVIVESTEISGRDVFEEIVDVDAILSMRDPFKDRLVELVKSHGGELLPE